MSLRALFPRMAACGWPAVGLLGVILVVALCRVVCAGIINQAVGGISISAEGLLNNAEVDQLDQLRKERQQAMERIPGELNQFNPMRKISLRLLEAAIADHKRNQVAPLADEIQLLAGLQRIEYVFVNPEQNDIILAGPAEGWRLHERGNVVGQTTGKPVLQLDDLLVALRTGRSAARGGLSCSIDPTAEGVQNVRRFVAGLRNGSGDIRAAVAGIEESLGPQIISVNGLPRTTHFAHVMVAADYRMKRIAMGLERAPVAGMPSYLEIMKVTSRGVQNMFPRWWLAPHYEPLLKDPDGLAWQLRGPGVKAMTEEDFYSEDGARRQSGQASPAAQAWADNMTAHYEELIEAEPIFGELRNLMDLAIVSALISKEQLTAKAGFDMHLLLDERSLLVDHLNAPKQVASQASFLKRGRDWVISASGGVMIPSWEIADQKEESPQLAPVRDEALKAQSTVWWWD